MKTSHIAIAALGLAAFALFNLKYGQEPKQAPSYPVPSDSARLVTAELPPLPIIPKATFPEINPPADVPLAIPAYSPMSPPLPLPSSAESPPSPLVQIPSIPLPPPPSTSSEVDSALPGVSSQIQYPGSPIVPSVPSVPQAGLPIVPQSPPVIPNVSPSSSQPSPINPTVPNSLIAPSSPLPVATPKPPISSEPTSSSTLGSFSPHGKFVVLKGKENEAAPERKSNTETMACKLIAIEGIGAVDKKNIVVQQGSLVRNIPRTEVLYVGETRNDVYCFMRDRVPADNEIARLAVARWCMFNGMREQSLAEAKAIIQFKPGCKPAVDLVRSLEESLKQFPPEGAATANKPTEVKTSSASDNELDITPEAATVFASRIQPILANLCIDCHARSDYAGTFKLTRWAGFEPGPQTSLANMRATVGQLNKSDPLNSPLLSKSVIAHGGLKQPPFQTRQAMGFRSLEYWAALAIGTPTAAPPAANQTNTSTTQPAVVSAPQSGFATPSAPAPGGLPPVETTPALPIANPMATPNITMPMAPIMPVVPPVVNVPPVLPTPSSLKPSVPSQPPIVPTIDTTPTLPAAPTIPVPPTVSIPQVPTAPSGMQPVTKPAPGSQFGVDSPNNPAQPSTGPTGRDEFDPSMFNQGQGARGKG